MKREPTEDGEPSPTEPADETFDSLIRKVARVSSTSPELPAPPVGTVVGEKYRLTALLGHGGMGAVFSAVHVVTDKPVAVKWLFSSTDNERARRRFLREARAAARIAHPNVIDVYDVGEVGSCGYLVMELLRGENLRDRMRRGPLEPYEAIGLLMPAMRGVAAVHRADVVHRDLKPENIFLCAGADGAAPQAKVLDFGISAMTSCDPHDPTFSREGLSGTPAYMAPECFEDKDADARMDVYSLGVILYETLTRRLPFEAASFAGMVLAITRDTPKPPSAWQPRLPRELDRVVMRALAKRPSDRFSTVGELLEALAPFATVQPELPKSAPSGRGKLALLCAFAACALGFLVWRSLQKHGDYQQDTSSIADSKTITSTAAARTANLVEDPFGSHPPYLAGPTCTACLEQRCEREQAACAANTSCSSLLAQARSSTAPLIANRDYLAQLFDGRWALDHGQDAWTTVRDKLTGCARNQCVDACGIGRDFACVGKFTWPASYPDNVQLHVRLLPQDDPKLSLAGWTTRACARGRSCEQLMGSATTDRGGFAVLHLDLTKNAPNARRMPEFDGEIDLDGGPAFYPQVMRQSAPFLHHWYKRSLISSREQLRQNHATRGLQVPDETHGLLQVQVDDCDFWNAWGLTLELWNYTASGYKLCTDCVVMYPDDTGLPDATLKEFQGLSLAAAEVALPAGDVMLIVRDTKSQRPTSVLQHVGIRAGHENSVVMFPASQEQLAALPPHVREQRPP